MCPRLLSIPVCSPRGFMAQNYTGLSMFVYWLRINYFFTQSQKKNWAQFVSTNQNRGHKRGHNILLAPIVRANKMCPLYCEPIKCAHGYFLSRFVHPEGLWHKTIPVCRCSVKKLKQQVKKAERQAKMAENQADLANKQAKVAKNQSDLANKQTNMAKKRQMSTVTSSSMSKIA